MRNDDPSRDHFEHNIRLTSAGDIISLIGKFTKSVPFTDAQNGFYGALCSTFANLAEEESAACDWEGLEAFPYPDFGASTDTYDGNVRQFYAVWMNFSTKKTFSWMDLYNYAEAPDRRVRRLMEKENKRLREEGIREFNDAVRSLVAFVRKRDPRYVPNSQSEADRQKLLREAAAAQAARSRAANKAKIDENSVPEWMRTRESEEEVLSESELSEEEYHECVICSKTFKSEKQYETHEKSKKHIKAVQQLKRQMQKENKLFQLESIDLSNGAASPHDLGSKNDSSVDSSNQSIPQTESFSSTRVSDTDSNSLTSSVHQVRRHETHEDNLAESLTKDVAYENESDRHSNVEDLLDDEYAPRQEVETRLSELVFTDGLPPNGDKLRAMGNIDHVILASDNTSVATSNSGGEELPKMGKAKAKRAKKAARKGVDTSDKSIPTVSVKLNPTCFR